MIGVAPRTEADDVSRSWAGSVTTVLPRALWSAALLLCAGCGGDGPDSAPDVATSNPATEAEPAAPAPALERASAPAPPGDPVVGGVPVPFRSQRAEFQAVADALTASENPFLGRGAVDGLRAQLASGTVPYFQRAQVQLALANKLLEHGEVDEAVGLLTQLVDQAEATFGAAMAVQQMSPVYARLCVAWLRKAEIENCILTHTASSCVFPLTGDGVHAEDAPARRALQVLERLAAAQPENLTVRWLLNVAAMAAGAWPDDVAAGRLLPPSAFASEADVGRFVDIAPRLGVDAFSLCGGVVCEDLTGDGWLDLLVSSYDPHQPLILYRATPGDPGEGGAPGGGGFEDDSARSRVDDQLGGLNLSAADFDDDGDVDVLVLRGAWLYDDGRIRNSLLANDGTGRFTDVTREAGLADPPRPSQTAAWGDFDGDGRLDLYVGNESRVVDDPRGDYPSQLFLNGGDGRFTDRARQAGVANDRFAKGVAAGDADNDGDLDLYVSNVGDNRLYRNDGEATFTDDAPAAGVTAPSGRSFACWFFDQDEDGWLDVFVSPFAATPGDLAAQALGRPTSAELPRLYRNTRDGRFADVTRQVGLDRVVLPMGADFGDLDNDGWLDLYLTTGDPSFETLMPNVMLRSDGGLRFQDVSASGGFGHLQKGHGVAFADLDHDGDQDVYHQLGGFYPSDGFFNALFENPGHGNRWLKVELVGAAANRGAVGARLRVVFDTPDGQRTLHRAVGSVSSFGGSPRRQELGLADAERVLRVEIDWPPPRGGTQVVQGVPLDAFVRITEGRPGFEGVPLSAVRF
jgi:hypothetical protein